MKLLYVLDADRNPVACEDVLLWAAWLEDNRRVALDEVAPGVIVSTVFLGLDHGFGWSGRPVLFETMVFDDYGGGDSYRCCTWQEAMELHAATVAKMETRTWQSTEPNT